MLKRYSKMPVKRTSKEAKSNKVFGQPRKQPKMFRAGLYARVSTLDQQTLPMQMRALRDYAPSVAGPSPCKSTRLALAP
jgi:hypothetical protein